MGIEYRAMKNGIRWIKLGGRLDIDGTLSIEHRLAEYTNDEHSRIILDFAEVDFLASIGIRLLVTTAKSITNRGGKIVILKPLPPVQEVLEITGITQAIPVFRDLKEAENYLMLN